MQLNSSEFFLLIICGLVLFYIYPASWYRRAVLIGISGAYISSYLGSFRDGAAILGYGSLVIGSAYLVAWRPRTTHFAAAMATLILLFLWLKKYFLFGAMPTLPDTISTVGISYILFRAIQLLSDILDGLTERKDLEFPDLILFVFSFLTFSAGPIQRYDDFRAQASQLGQARIRDVDWAGVVSRCALGYFKLVVLAPLLLALHNDTAATAATSSAALAVSSVLFIFYVFINFSGYMDVVLGVGLAFSLKMPENFDKPYLCTSYLGLWSSWHITLSRNFQTYVFYPLVRILATSRLRMGTTSAGICGYFIVFFLLGLWHGNTLPFAVFGLLLALGASVNKAFEVWRVKSALGERLTPWVPSPWYRATGRALAIAYFAFAAVPAWSRVGSLHDLGQIYHLSHPGHTVGAFAICVAGLLLIQAAAWGGLAVLRTMPSAVLRSSLPHLATGFSIVLALYVACMVEKPVSTLIFYQRF